MGERLVVVSGDCHADPASPTDFRQYVSEGFLDAFDSWVVMTEKMREMSMEQLFSGEHVDKRAESSGFEGTDDEMEQHRVALTTGFSRTSDPDVRLKELAADGV